ncbi:TPA: hypothetical protein MFM55_005234 [Klebsiella pneumoniae]|nr:hypothetical protein [Klebsiella pneumoniae]
MMTHPHNHPLTYQTVTQGYCTCRNHPLRDNKQSYNHSAKLPDGRSGEIRLFTF